MELEAYTLVAGTSSLLVGGGEGVRRKGREGEKEGRKKGDKEVDQLTCPRTFLFHSGI